MDLKNGWGNPVWQQLYGNGGPSDPAALEKALINPTSRDSRDPLYIKLLKEGASKGVPQNAMTLDALDMVLKRKLS